MALAERDLDVAPLLRAGREIDTQMAIELHGASEIVGDEDDHREPGCGHERSTLRSDRGRWLHSGTALAVPATWKLLTPISPSSTVDVRPAIAISTGCKPGVSPDGTVTFT